MYRVVLNLADCKKNDFGILDHPCREFFVSSSDEVCEIITAVSHLNPIITLQKIDFSSVSDVLGCFESKKL